MNVNYLFMYMPFVNYTNSEMNYENVMWITGKIDSYEIFWDAGSLFHF